MERRVGGTFLLYQLAVLNVQFLKEVGKKRGFREELLLMRQIRQIREELLLLSLRLRREEIQGVSSSTLTQG